MMTQKRRLGAKSLTQKFVVFAIAARFTVSEVMRSAWQTGMWTKEHREAHKQSEISSLLFNRNQFRRACEDRRRQL